METKRKMWKKCNFSVKALALNGALLKERNSAYKLFSPGECSNCTEIPEMFCAWILAIPMLMSPPNQTLSI